MGLQYQPQSLGDTTLTKVFVGGLAWETQKEVLREHFDQYGEILEAVIISDKITSRSKGYGFVTFKEPEAAKKACEDATPVINGRRANCNLASLGARRRPSPPATPPPIISHQPAMGVNVPRPSTGPPAPWYYHPAGPPPPPSPYHQRHHYPGVVPVYPAAGAGAYGYSPSYVTEMPYTTPAKLNPHPQGQFAYPSQGGMVTPNTMMPMYPMYNYHHHHPQAMSVHAAQFYPQSTAPGAVTTIPTIISKPVAVRPATVCYAVEQVTSCN